MLKMKFSFLRTVKSCSVFSQFVFKDYYYFRFYCSPKRTVAVERELKETDAHGPVEKFKFQVNILFHFTYIIQY
jgi:hypothetical protein